MSQVQCFTNDVFKVLACLYDMKDINNKAHTTQQEIADNLELSRVTINKIMGELKDLGYLKQDGKHLGRYIITEKAISVVETFKSIEK